MGFGLSGFLAEGLPEFGTPSVTQIMRYTTNTTKDWDEGPPKP